MTMRAIPLFFALLALSFVACEKVIDIDLNSTDPRLVIEANLSDTLGECIVSLTRTLNFDDTVAFPRLTGALVTLRDLSNGTIDTIPELSPGRYAKPSLAGISGRTYELTVNYDGQTYMARGTMPPKVNLDSILVDSSRFTGPRGPAGSDGLRRVNLLVFPIFEEPAGQANQYYFQVTQRDTLNDDFFIYSDLGADGQALLRPIFVQTWEQAEVIIDLQCIDQATYTYLEGLNLNLGQNSATPSNPAGNFSNGALGHFKVHTTSKKRFIVQ